MEQQIKRYVPVSRKILITLSNQLNAKINNRSAKDNYRIPECWATLKNPKSIIKQILYYAAICDSDGEIDGVLTEDVAKAIDVTERTVLNNNKYLEKLGIISTKNSKYFWCFWITLNDYLLNWKGLASQNEKNHPNESHGGYILITDDLLKELFAMECVNTLRIAIAFILNEYHKTEKEIIVSYKEIKSMLPPYLRHKSSIKKIVMSLDSLFNTKILDTIDIKREYKTVKKTFKNATNKLSDLWAVSYQLPAFLNGLVRKTAEIREGNKLFLDFIHYIQDNHVVTPNISSNDMHSHILEFGTEVCKKGLERIKFILNESITFQNETPYKIVHGYIRPGKSDDLKENKFGFYHDVLESLERNFSKFLRNQLESLAA